LLDEDNHLTFLDGSGVILIEGAEDLIESLIGELVTGSEVTEGVLNEFLGLFLIEGTALIDVIGFPDLVDDTLGNLGSGDEFSDEAFDEVFATFDKDNSGTVEKNEMVVFIKQLLGGN